MSRVYEVTQRDTLPVVTSFNVDALYTQQGHLQFRFKAPVAMAFTGDEPYQEFPQGINVVFFDSLLNPKTKLTADYAISYERSRTMEARRNVVVVNFSKDEKINTEHLVWDQEKRIIFSNTFVKITTTTNIIYGEKGFESNEAFDNWVIKKTSGELEVEKI